MLPLIVNKCVRNPKRRELLVIFPFHRFASRLIFIHKHLIYCNGNGIKGCTTDQTLLSVPCRIYLFGRNGCMHLYLYILFLRCYKGSAKYFTVCRFVQVLFLTDAVIVEKYFRFSVQTTVVTARSSSSNRIKSQK